MSIQHKHQRSAVRRTGAAMAVLGLLVPAAAATDCTAQAAPAVRWPAWSVSVDAGVAGSTRWFRAPGADGTPGVGPTFGAGAEVALSPVAGVRVHGAFARQHVRSVAVSSLGIAAQHVGADLLFYDVSVVARPFAAAGSDAARGAWVSAGGGAVSAWFTGDTATLTDECTPEFTLSGVCVSGRTTTHPQAIAAIGFDAVPLTPRVTLFASLGVHVYQPPVEAVEPPFLPTDNRTPARPPVAAVRRQFTGVPGVMSVAGTAAMGKLTLGVRVASRRAVSGRAPPPPPSAADGRLPTVAPTTGGYVEVKTAAPGAAVYLVPFNRWRRATMLCRLRPVHGANTYYQGTTASQVAVNALIRRPVTHFLVVVQGGRYYEERIQVVNNGVERRQLNLAVDGAPTGCR